MMLVESKLSHLCEIVHTFQLYSINFKKNYHKSIQTINSLHYINSAGSPKHLAFDGINHIVLKMAKMLKKRVGNCIKQMLLLSHLHYTTCPKKAERFDFHYFAVRKYSIIYFHQIDHCLLKRMISRSMKLVDVVLILWSFLKTWSMSFLFIFVMYQAAILALISDFHTLLPGCPLIRAKNRKKERTCRQLYLPFIAHADLTNICK